MDPVLASVTLQSEGSVGALNSPREAGKQLSDYVSKLPVVAQAANRNKNRRNDVLSQSMTVSSRHSTDGKSSAFQAIGTSMT